MNRIPRKHKGDFDEFFLKEFASAIGNNYEFHFCFVLFLDLCGHLLFITYLSINLPPNDMFHIQKNSSLESLTGALKPSIPLSIYQSTHPFIHSTKVNAHNMTDILLYADRDTEFGQEVTCYLVMETKTTE